MNKKKTKVKWSKKLYHIFLFAFICSVFLYVGTSYNSYCKLKDQEQKLLIQIQQEQKKSIELNNELELNQTDAYVEKVAREKLGYLKSTEIKYINRSK